MKNVIITIFVIVGVFILISVFDSGKSTTAQYSEEYSGDYSEDYYDLQSCLEEWKEAHSEYKMIIEEAYSNLDGWGEGDEYDDLITAMEEAKYNLDSAGDTHLIVIEEALRIDAIINLSLNQFCRESTLLVVS